MRKATVPFYKADADWSEFLLELNGPLGEWVDFVPPGEQPFDGLTMFMKLYRDEDVGIFLFRSEGGATIPPHWHRWPERVVFLSGRGTLRLNRDSRQQYDLAPANSAFIPAGTLHEGHIGDAGMSVCTFYYR